MRSVLEFDDFPGLEDDPGNAVALPDNLDVFFSGVGHRRRLCHLNGVLCLSSQERSPRSFACTASFAGKSRLCTVIPMTAAQQKDPNSCANYSNRPVDVKRASSVRLSQALWGTKPVRGVSA